MNINQRLKRVEQLKYLVAQVESDICNLPYFAVTEKQAKVLYDILRHLDLIRDYKLGYRLRKAFKMEIDRRTKDYYGKDKIK